MLPSKAGEISSQSLRGNLVAEDGGGGKGRTKKAPWKKASVEPADAKGRPCLCRGKGETKQATDPGIKKPLAWGTNRCPWKGEEALIRPEQQRSKAIPKPAEEDEGPKV